MLTFVHVKYMLTIVFKCLYMLEIIYSLKVWRAKLQGHLSLVLFVKVMFVYF